MTDIPVEIALLKLQVIDLEQMFRIERQMHETTKKLLESSIDEIIRLKGLLMESGNE